MTSPVHHCLPAHTRFDIFCTVIDNYGDAGVCWRLARQLAKEYDGAVRLWIDDLAVLQRLIPSIVRTELSQCIAGVDVRHWQYPFVDVESAAVVIEAFGCQLPENYVQAMAHRAPQALWINLEYLSAENWVADCHGLSSPQAHLPSLNKYFFFPGFTADTGGLLCERELLAQRQTFQTAPRARAEFLARFGLTIAPTIRTVSLFAYDSCPLRPLLDAWVHASQPLWCLVPEGRIVAEIAQFFGESNLGVGAVRQRGALSVTVLPFLSQDDYDRLLWSCDLNFVRGEDSFVRAQWAARPFIWQIYPQQDSAHGQKLEAFLHRYQAALPAEAALCLTNCWWAWNGIGAIEDAWRELQSALPALTKHAQDWSRQLAQRENLAAALVQFCANHV